MSLATPFTTIDRGNDRANRGVVGEDDERGPHFAGDEHRAQQLDLLDVLPAEHFPKLPKVEAVGYILKRKIGGLGPFNQTLEPLPSQRVISSDVSGQSFKFERNPFITIQTARLRIPGL